MLVRDLLCYCLGHKIALQSTMIGPACTPLCKAPQMKQRGCKLCARFCVQDPAKDAAAPPGLASSQSVDDPDAFELAGVDQHEAGGKRTKQRRQ